MSDETKKDCGCAGKVDGDPTAEQQAKAEKAAEDQAKATGQDTMLPQVTFSTFILSLGSSAMVQLGEVPDPNTGKIEENLLLAKHTIDVLSMLKDKTQRCVDQDEARLIEGLLYELRMKYVCKTK
ncbi:MAG: DUF1844 domain-containing protein [Desulfovibrio sp.]|nr:MAG: DUF1844 domain-containing protein [Desulfovibrio sp.]